MCRKPPWHPERGVGLIAAIFVVVVLGLLGTALVRLVTTEQSAVNREFASTQAFFAAETAVQWGLYQVIAQGNSAAFPQAAVFDGNAPAGLRHCDGATRALTEPRSMGTAPTFSSPEALYRFQVVGLCHGGTPEEARRRLEVRFSD